VKVEYEPAGGEQQRVFLVRLLQLGPVLGRAQERPAAGGQRPELLLTLGSTRVEVLAEGLTVVWVGCKLKVRVEARTSVWVLLVAEPGNAGAAGELGIGQPGVIAGATASAFPPSIEGALGI
jgi:hypothetical protein